MKSSRIVPCRARSSGRRSSLNLFRGLALTVDGVNLTNEKIVQFDTDRFRPRAIYDNGRYYFFGVRYQQ